MPLNLPNWMQAPMQTDAYKGFGDFAQNAMGAYYGVQEQQREKEKAAQDMMLGKQKLEAGDITNKYLESLKKAEIAEKEAHAKYFEQGGGSRGGVNATPFMKEAQFLYPDDPEKQREYVERRASGMEQNIRPGSTAEVEGIPQEVMGIPWANLTSKNERSDAAKRNYADQKVANGMTAMLPVLSEMEKLVDEDPDLWKSYTAILEGNKELSKSDLRELFEKNFITDEKRKTAIDKFNKLTGELIVQGKDAFGGGDRFTDAKLRLLEQIKPDIRNTPEANRFVIQKLKDQMSAGPEWAKALRAGEKKRIGVINDPEFYRARYKASKGNEAYLPQEGAPALSHEVISQEMNKPINLENPETGQVETMTYGEALQRGLI